jgi:hypothetical protein
MATEDIKAQLARIRTRLGGQWAARATEPDPEVPVPAGAVRWEVRIKTESLNVREHPRSKATRVAYEREQTRLAALTASRADLQLRHLRPPYLVTLTRRSPGTLDAHDNLRGALKHVVDEVAAMLNVDDGSPAVTWAYRQELGSMHGVRICVERRP